MTVANPRIAMFVGVAVFLTLAACDKPPPTPTAAEIEAQRAAIEAEAVRLAAGIEARGAATARSNQLADGLNAIDRQDWQMAFRLLRPLADEGDAWSQYKLAELYFKGQGVPRDQAEAVRWLHRAAEQDLMEAQAMLGYVYTAGAEGVMHDDAEAVKWLRKAADHGDPVSEYNLGNMYNEGRGVTRDYAQALAWFRKAADQDVATAQFNLGVMYAEARGVRRNYMEAARWYRKAAGQGFAQAQYNLGLLYGQGLGIRHDRVLAHMWIDLAAAQGLEGAAMARDSLEPTMAPTQIAEAKKLAREWQPSVPQAAAGVQPVGYSGTAP